MSIRGGIVSQSRPAGRTAPPGQISSSTSGIGGSSLRTPGPTAPSAAAKFSLKTPTTPTPTVGNSQSGTGNKLQQPQASTAQHQQQQQQQQTQQQAKVQSSPTVAQQPPQPPQEPDQQLQRQAPKTQISPPATSQPTPTKPPTTQVPQLQPPPSAASKPPNADPTTSAVHEPQQPQPVQPTRPPLPTIALVLDPPSELAFRGSFKNSITAHMRLTNPSPDTRLCYKLRTTAPHLYCARPSVDVIGPNQTADIRVILQAASVDVADINVRHKLMVQWISVPDGQISSHDKLWQQSRPQEVSNAKISCVLDRIPEKTTENGSFVENGIEPISSQMSYSATRSSQTKTEPTSSSSSKSTSSTPTSGILFVLLVVVVAVIAALLYNNKE